MNGLANSNQKSVTAKRKFLTNIDNKMTKKLKTKVNDQPSCSKSLEPNEVMGKAVGNLVSLSYDPQERNKDIENIPPSDDLLENVNIPLLELDNFFEVETFNDTTQAAVVPEDQGPEDREEVVETILGNTWKRPVGNHQEFDYSAEGGLHGNFAAVLINDLSPINCFRTFLDDDIIEDIVNQTNLYATQTLCNENDILSNSRLHQWVPTDRKEIIKFIGIVAYMGLVRMPSLEKYWSNDVLYKNFIIPKIMSRNRFQLLLRMWHFSDNANCKAGDRLHKIRPLLEKLLRNFQNIYTPGRTFCIDESVIPFQGRLLFKQYIPQKTHKYGIKLFKLCSDNGYTWNIRIYAGKEKYEGDASVPTNIVIKLSKDLLNSGRTIVADNYYTSLELANILLSNKTHYIGTLRANRRGNPEKVIGKKLQKGEVYGLENERGICVLKWKDKRDVLMLSTKHTTETVNVQRRAGVVRKPKAIMEYNDAKSSIDQSDQMASYNTALRKSLKWYRKLAIEFILGTALVNSHIIYNLLADKKMNITSFREQVVRALLSYDSSDPAPLIQQVTTPSRKSVQNHQLLKKEGLFDKVRKYCKGCYAKKTRGELTKSRVKKVATYCNTCEGQPHFCLNCYNIYHK